MITVLINALLALGVGVFLTLTGVSPWYWSIFWGVLTLIFGQVVLGWILRWRMSSISSKVQTIMARGQARMQAKMQRWRTHQVGDPKAAEAELAHDRDVLIAEVQSELQPLERYRWWIPLLGRQLATMELQFAWQRKDWNRVDALLSRALLLDPRLVCIKLARQWQQNVPTEMLYATFRKASRRARYGTSALLYATFAWMLVKRGDVDGAFKVLIEANDKNEHPVLKTNREILANNRLAHFSNAGFGDEWYALWLENPKIKAQRQRNITRYFR